MPNEAILTYLKETYHPLSVIVYGSFADGSNNKYSDFDALLVVEQGAASHDISVVDGVRLDVFVYPVGEVEDENELEEFVQILDGKVICDTDGIGQNLLDRVSSFLNDMPYRPDEELREELVWCQKMLERAGRSDTEAQFRRHWLLTDSLEIACDVLHQTYRGPKKSLKWLREEHPALFALYDQALRTADIPSLTAWIDRLCEYCPA